MSEKRPRPQHDKYSSPDFERQQRQRTGDPTANLPSRLQGRLSWSVTDGEQEQHHTREDADLSRGRDRQRSSSQDRGAQQQEHDGMQRNNSGSGGRARIEFNLDKLQSPPPPEETKPRVSSKYSSGRDPGSTADPPPVMKRLSGTGGGSDSRGGAAAASAERVSREQQRGTGSSRRQQSPGLSGPKGANRLRERERERDRQRERPQSRERDFSQRRAAGAAERAHDSSRDLSRPRDRDEVPERSRDRSRPGDRERSRERVVQGSRERGKEYGTREAPPREPSAPRGAAARDEAGRRSAARDSSRAREGDRDRSAARDARDDGFARPQPRPPPAPQQQQQPQQPPRPVQPRPHRPHIQWDEISKADGMLAAVQARQAGLVEAQLSKLILTRALATDNVWDKACKAANVPSEQLDGPEVTATRRADCESALMARASAHMMPPLDPSVPPTLEAVGEDVYIKQLQALINRYEQQSAAPFCADVWALKGSGQVAKRGAGRQQDEERASYSLLLPAELRGMLWDV